MLHNSRETPKFHWYIRGVGKSGFSVNTLKNVVGVVPVPGVGLPKEIGVAAELLKVVVMPNGGFVVASVKLFV